MNSSSNNHKRNYSINAYLRIETCGGAIFSPGTKTRHAGREIAFIYNGSGNFQIYKMLARYPGSWPQRMTFTDERTTNPMYTSDGGILYSSDTGGDEKWQIYFLRSGPGAEPLAITNDSESMHNLTYVGENGYYFQSNKRNKKIFDIHYGKFEDIYKEEKSSLLITNPGINPIEVLASYSNRWLLIREQAGNFESSLHLYDLQNQKLIPLTSEFSKGKDARWEDAWFLDDTYMLVISDFGRDFLSLGLINWQNPLEGISWLEPDQYDTENVDVHVNSRKIVYTKNKDGYSKLYFGILTKQNHFHVKELSLPEGAVIEGGDRRSFIRPIAWNPAGDRLAVTLSTPLSPINVWIYELRDYSFGYWKLTQADGAGIPSSEYSFPELFRFNSLHNLKIPYFLYLPTQEQPSTGWPTIIWIHGGPEAQIRPSFNPIIQFYVASGFAVVTPNVRGSTGYGRRYSALDDLEKRLDSVADIYHLVEHLKTDKRIDISRLAVYGGSYGGYMVLASITEYPQLFSAAVDVVGISNFISFLENTAQWRRHLREKEYGSITVDRDLLERISPINKVGNITTPTLIVHGANDQRVPISEAEQIYDELNTRNISTEFIRFMDEGHGVVKLKNKVHLYPQIINFLKIHLKMVNEA
ncbi:MAG: S9 family peptidase [Candidatus Thorarchaeota archaeon]